MHLIRNVKQLLLILKEKNKKKKRWKGICNSVLNSQMPVLISFFYPTNKYKVQPVLVTTDLNIFLIKNILESSKTEGK